MHFSAFILLLSSALCALAAPTIQPIVLHTPENATSIDNTLAKRADLGNPGWICPTDSQKIIAGAETASLLEKPIVPFKMIKMFYYATNKKTAEYFDKIRDKSGFMRQHFMKDGKLGGGMYLGADHNQALIINWSHQQEGPNDYVLEFKLSKNVDTAKTYTYTTDDRESWVEFLKQGGVITSSTPEKFNQPLVAGPWATAAVYRFSPDVIIYSLNYEGYSPASPQC